MTYDELKLCEPAELARRALRGDLAAGECLLSRLDEVARDWAAVGPFDRRAISAACARTLVPGDAPVQYNVVQL